MKEIANNELLSDAIVYENNHKNNEVEKVNKKDLSVEVLPTSITGNTNIEQALNIGLIQEISSYTTSYTTGAGTENRNDNIALAAASINNSICYANGSYWSFNEVVGDTTPEKGYKEAGTIIDNRYSKSIGGGVCQVATTVFNAVYDSGLEINTRFNHDLHIASYPVGRDAAITYPYFDLVWTNDLKSDILVVAECSGYSITVKLLGVNPGYTVKTETGKWEEGEKFKQQFVVDPSKEPNSKFVQTNGSDGKSIIVKRSVYDIYGNLIREKEFKSVYKPKDEIVVLGPGDEANKLLNEKQARMKDETDNW